jgi:hypothetical protein
MPLFFSLRDRLPEASLSPRLTISITPRCTCPLTYLQPSLGSVLSTVAPASHFREALANDLEEKIPVYKLYDEATGPVLAELFNTVTKYLTLAT